MSPFKDSEFQDFSVEFGLKAFFRKKGNPLTGDWRGGGGVTVTPRTPIARPQLVVTIIRL